MMARKRVVGLIGGMGSGKSQVAAELARRGGRVISADQVGHEALRQPDIRRRIIARFGEGVRTEAGEIDRRKLGAVVFGNADERRALEALVHPWMTERMEEEIRAGERAPEWKFTVLDAAILLEAGWDRICDEVIYVEAPRGVRLQRLARQRGWSGEELEARERAQMPLDEKRRRADRVIDNGGSLEELSRQVEELVERWKVR